MIPITFRALPAWPYPTQKGRPATYRLEYDRTLKQLRSELAELKASDVIVGIVADPRDVRKDGLLRADARVRHPGVELSFSLPSGQRVAFHTDRHRSYSNSWQDNLRAIVLGMEALRAVDRYGITETGQQYAGFAALPAGAEESAERGRLIVVSSYDGDINLALRMTHPDQGGNARDFGDVAAYRKSLRG